ncbi:GNAT family N-acetyltransferase [Paenibacillus sp. LS1]|uniref:GNAT family N-acetyltransferase n=1 Tax=Paenibacillus sp. LS1 TaxID=2992120 RepID=UPI0022305008|nr:GNAT family N-acetyltransferase [Paenibacillus sp. LS1]MCW3793806.1 GNAT family N-acetyltransferase [Paenibacillus sp. LS1]
MSNNKFTDKKGRLIVIVVTDQGLTAEHDEEIIGVFNYEHVTFDDDYYDSEHYKLCLMDIKPDYRRAGIGIKMLEYGATFYKQIEYPEDETENYPTLEGAALLNAANKKGVIKLNYIHDDDDEDEYENDFEFNNNKVESDTKTTSITYTKSSGSIEVEKIIAFLLRGKNELEGENPQSQVNDMQKSETFDD